jgi:hypothetical protein
MAGVGTRKVFEDDRVIVWQFDLEPGDQGELHTHSRDYAVRVIEGGTLEVRGPDGELLYTAQRKGGDAACFRMQGDQIASDFPGYTPIPATHQVRNVGTTTFREVLIEFKD